MGPGSGGIEKEVTTGEADHYNAMADAYVATGLPRHIAASLTFRQQAQQATQNKRLADRQATEDVIAGKLKGVRGAGTFEDEYEVRQGEEAAPDFTGPGSGVKKVKTVRTAADADRERADIIASGGTMQDVKDAAALRQNANATETAERAERYAKGQELLLRAGQLKAMGNREGAARLLQQGYNEHVPDGHQLVIETKDGVPHWGVAGPDGKFVSPLEPITDKSLEERINQGIDMLSAENKYKREELGLKKDDIAVHRMTAEAAQKQAESNRAKVEYDTTGPGGQAHLQYLKDQGIYLDRHGRALLQQAQTHAANNKRLSPAEKAKELTEFYTPLIMDANPGMPVEQARMKAAQVALRDPNARESRMTAIAGTDMMTDGKTIYRTGADGQIEEVMLPPDLKKWSNVLVDQAKANKAQRQAKADGLVAGPPTADASAFSALANAEKKLSTYGLAQQKNDKAGYDAALRQRDEARAAIADLDARYAATQSTGAARVSPRP
jgi:hypothetical protein